jgi:hypothetical protein
MKKSIWPSLLLLGTAFIVTVVPELLKVYFIMPMPGSQLADNVELAYFINGSIWFSRIAGGLLFLLAAKQILNFSAIWSKIILALTLVVVFAAVYATNFVLLADKMFKQPENKILATRAQNKITDKQIIIGVFINGEARAYPIQIIGYHHQVRDTVGGEQIMVTYCTVCRTGRVYKPEVNGKTETFRLVGMDQFNAMFEDATTKSWWRQATGECCAGPLKGARLKELPCRQMSMAAWETLYPSTLVLQQDPKFLKAYKHLEGYDNGLQRGGLTGTDTVSFNAKAWVIGVKTRTAEKMYDWNELKSKRIIQDNVGDEPIVLLIDKDNQSFYAFSRISNNTLNFSLNPETQLITDSATQSTWSINGKAVSIKPEQRDLTPVVAYQEFYHSFKTFHPTVAVYK